MMISFEVYGTPQTAGSKRAMPVTKKDGTKFNVVIDDNKKSPSWKQEVASQCRKSYAGPLLDCPLKLIVEFRFARPKKDFRTNGTMKNDAPIWHSTKPDVTKLVRAIEDGLNKVLWTDDSRVCDQHIYKRYVNGNETAGACVVVVPIEHDRVGQISESTPTRQKQLI